MRLCNVITLTFEMISLSLLFKQFEISVVKIQNDDIVVALSDLPGSWLSVGGWFLIPKVLAAEPQNLVTA